jgi:outer membrane protein assembly factor BamB
VSQEECVTSPTPERIPPEVAKNSALWPLPNRDYASARANFDSNISAETIDRLEVAWTFDLPETTNWGAAASNPLVIDGVVYYQDLPSNIFALDFETGKAIWNHRGEGRSIAPNGLAVGYCKVFAAVSASYFEALDIETGLTLWRAEIELTDFEGINIQPIVYDGLVYLSTAPRSEVGLYLGDGMGIIYALNQETGDIVWSFNTVDSDDIWGNREVNSGGGAWFPASIDTERGITYWGVGNPGPWPGTDEFPNGSSRPGPNLYTDSVVALDHKTGELVWFNQVRPHDNFDLDFHVTPILTTAQIEGQARDVAIGAGKTGTVHAFDADTGEEFWVTAVGIHQNDDLEEVPLGESVVVYPGALGGVETFMAYADGVVYVPVMNLPTTFTATTAKTESLDGTGILVAIEADTGDILWETDFDDIVVGSATVVNDLVITSVFGGIVYALDRATGESVWSYKASAGLNAPMAIAGDTIIVPAGMPNRAGNKTRLIALRLVE